MSGIAEAVAIVRLAILLQAFLTTGAIGIQVRDHGVFCAVLAVLADRDCRLAGNAILVADEAPVGEHAFVLVEGGTALQQCQCDQYGPGEEWVVLACLCHDSSCPVSPSLQRLLTIASCIGKSWG